MDTVKDNRFVWFNRGKLLAKLGKLEAALDCFDRAIAMKESYYEAWCEKGCVLEELGRVREGEICFNKSLGAFCGDISLSLEDDLLSIS
ncbi:MAG: tetratricopeptide repeat protein [Xenococcaceae cyanobacterium MO_167.B27]|nr:tetratricopeptide repeat protein [Xenococcaceae cyanobacterium MO_167.B27]